MERIRTTELAAHTGERVRLRGWLHQFRELGKINFLIVRDGWGTAQAIVDDRDALEALRAVQVESIIEVSGLAVAVPQAPGGVELQETRVRVIEALAEPPPVEINKREMKASLDTFLDHAVVGLRHPKRRAVLRLEAALTAGFRAFLDSEGFTEIQTPKLLGAASEGGAEVFTVDYFDRPAFLAQSPQLYKQMAVGILERVYEAGPAFRAEPHATARHLAEYASLDVEMGFIEDHYTVMAMARGLIAAMIAEVQRRCPSEIALLGLEPPLVPETIPAIWFPDAQELLESRFGITCRGEPDLAPEHERTLGRWAQEEHASDFLFVTGYPMVKRPFYTQPDPAHPDYSNSFDLLFRGLEIVTGGQRLHRYTDYLAALQQRSMSGDPVQHYLEAFRHGMPPHGGFAIGLERFAMQLTGLPNVRLATLFPRDLTRLAP